MDGLNVERLSSIVPEGSPDLLDALGYARARNQFHFPHSKVYVGFLPG